MCGIGGIVKVTPAGDAAKAALGLPGGGREAIPEAWLDILDESIRHRGPDGQGRFRDRVVRADGSVVDVALVHRRLAIIDPATGQQPMVSVRGGAGLRAGRDVLPARAAMMPLLFHGKPDAPVVYAGMREVETHGRDAHSLENAFGQDAHATGGADLVAVVFNGCIYNHRELRKELLAAGHEFVSDHSDTEVLLHGWRAWGEGLFDRLDGMYALAIWDAGMGELILSRDSFGEKPLLFARGLDQSGAMALTFASVATPMAKMSMHKAIAPEHQRCDRGLEEWLRFGHAATPPGEFLCTVGAGRTYVERGSDYRHEPHGPVFSEAGRPARTTPMAPVDAESLLVASIRDRLEADVPLGCFLSGGIDSSLVAFLARRELGGLRSFCVRMPDPRDDESEIASEVARIAGTTHSTLDCRANPAADLQMLIRQVGVPLGDSSLLPTYWVSGAARAHVAVALAGDGGDEMFLGYERYRAAALIARHRGLLAALDVPLRRLPVRGTRSLLARGARLAAAANGLGYTDLASVFPSRELRQLLSRPPQPGYHDGRWTGLSEAVLWDVQFYLPNDLMRKVDTASMAVALEVRSPFLAPTLAKSCLSATPESLMPRGRRKGLLRQVARKYFPAAIVYRPKQGFAIPIGEWFRSDYGGMKQLLMDHLESAEPWGPARLGIDLNMKFVRQMLDEHMNERRDHSQRLYMLLVLSIWAKWMGKL